MIRPPLTERAAPAEVSRRLAGCIGELAAALAGEPTERGRTTWRFRSRGSLSVEVAGHKRGSWFDYEAGIGGDALALVMHLRRDRFPAATTWALGWLGEAPAASHHLASVPACPRAEREDRVDRCRWSADKARCLWHEAVAADAPSSVVPPYLDFRGGLRIEPGMPLRFHPKAWRNAAYGLSGPAMLALMTSPETGEPCGVHVTYLRLDGRGKAAGDRVKVMLGSAGVVRLAPDQHVSLGLGLAEGIETSLAVMQRAGWRPVWAATSAGAMRHFPIMAGVEAVTLFADFDGPGLRAARDCGVRWAQRDRQARIMVPPVGDWDDATRRGFAA